MAYNTGNPIGSLDPRDAADNKENFDRFANSTAATYTDRLGVPRKTMRGIETSAESRITNALANWTQPVARGAWTTATAYNTGELWDTGGTLYLVVEDYTSGASAAADIAAGHAVEYTNINRQRVFVSLADMENATPLYDGEAVYLSAGGRSGVFIGKLGDYSTEVAADPLQGVYVATGAGAAVSCWVRELQGFVTPGMFGYIADGGDYSTRMDGFFSFCNTFSITGMFDGEDIRVPSLSRLEITNGLVLRAKRKPKLRGEFTAEQYPFVVVSGSVDIEYIEFSGFTDIVTAGDGYGGSMPYSLSSDIDLIRINNCDFEDCRRPLFLSTTAGGNFLRKLDLQNNTVDGKTGATQYGWTGFYANWADIDDVVVRRNKVKNIDATAAGYAGTGEPLVFGNGRAILVGSTVVTDATYEWHGWNISKNAIENVQDSRNKANGINPEVGGIRVTGARGVKISDNSVKTILSNGTGVDDDCEGIYTQTSESAITGNTLKNAGKNGGAIVIKGRNEALETDTATRPEGFNGVCSDNVITNPGTYESSGIAVYTSGWDVHDNVISGAGGDSSRYAAIWTNAQNNSGTNIHDNTLKNCVGRFGILMTSYGDNISIDSNKISGVTGAVVTASQSLSVIYVLNTDGNGYNTGNVPLSNVSLSRNKISGISATYTGSIEAITVRTAGSDTEQLEIIGNKVRGSVDSGIGLLSGTITGVQISGNRIDGATDWLATGATVTGLSARDNGTWLYTEISANPASIAPGAYAVVATGTITDLSSRDSVIVTTNTLRQGLLFWVDITSSAGDVSVYAKNNTGSSIDLSTTTFRLSAEKLNNTL